MAKQYKVGIIISGDAKGGVQAVQATREQLDKLNTSQKKVSKNSDAFSKAMASSAHKAAAWGVALLGANSAFSAFTNQLSDIDKIGKLSDRIGASTEALSEYQHVAELTGVTFSSLTTAWQRQARRIAEAAQGTGEAKNALKELGLSAEALAKLAPEQQFEVLADSLDGVANQGDRVRLAMKLWDTEGVALLQTTKGGADSIRAMRDEARQLGLSLSGDQVDNVENFNDSLTRLSNGLKGAFLPIITEATTGLASFSTVLAENSRTVANVMVATGKLIVGATVAIGAYRVAALAATAQTQLFASAIGLLKKSIAPVFAAFAGWEIGTLLRKEFVEVRIAGLALVGGLSKAWEGIKLAFHNTTAYLEYAWNAAIETMKSAFASFLDGVASITDWVPGLGGATEKIKQYADSLKNGKNASKQLADQLKNNEKAHTDAVNKIDENIDALVEYELNSEKAAEGTEKVVTSNKNLADQLTQTGSATGVLTDTFKQSHEASVTLAGDLEQLKRKLNPVYAKTVDYKQEQALLNRAYERGLLTLSDYIDQLGLLEAKYKETTDKTGKLSSETEKLIDKADPFATAWEEATKRIDQSFANAWKGAFESFESFSDSIINAFKDMVAEMAHQSITKPLTQSITGAIGGAFSGGGGFSFSSLFSSGAGSGSLAGKGGQAVVGGVDSTLSGGLSGAMTAGAPGLVAALAMNSLGTIFDDNASNARRRNNIGLLTGGLGFLIPSSIFGKPSDKTQSVTVGADLFEQGGHTGDKFSQENRDAADNAGAALSAMFEAIERKTGEALDDIYNINIGSRDGVDLYKNGETVFENRLDDVEAIMDEIFDDMLAGGGIASDVYKQLQQETESLASAMTRVDVQFATITEMADQVGLNFSAMGDQGLIAADALVQAAGGLDKLVQGTAFFYENFFTEQEKFDKIVNNLTASFTDLGQTFPQTREQFKDLVTSVTDPQTYARLLELAPAADTYYNQLETWTDQLTGMYQQLLDREPDSAGLQFYIDQLISGGMTLEQIGDSMAGSVEAIANSGDSLQEASSGVNRSLDEGTNAFKNLGNSVRNAVDYIKEMTASADEFAGGLARDALLEGMSSQERDVFLLNEWKTKAIEQLTEYTEAGIAILGGPDTVLKNIEKIYGTRLGQIRERYTDVIITGEEATSVVKSLTDATVDFSQVGKDRVALDRLVLESEREVVAALGRESQTLLSFVDKMGGLSRSLRDFERSLLTSDLSTLSPSQQFSASRSQYNEIARKAKLGDIDAINQLESATSSFLTKSKEYQGSAGNGYASDFELVRSNLQATADLVDRQKGTAERQLEKMTAQVEMLGIVEKRLLTLEEAIQQLRTIQKSNAGMTQQLVDLQTDGNQILTEIKDDNALEAS